MLINEDDEVYVIGSQSTGMWTSEVVIRKYGAQGELLFEKTMSTENELDLGFSKSILHQGNLILAGGYGIASGIVNLYELHVIEMDGDNGTTNWSLKDNESIFNHLTSSIAVDQDNNLIIAGTCCYTDVLGDERAFLLKINPSATNTIKQAKSNLTLYPNPISGRLNISDPDNIIQSIELLDIHSRIILKQNHSKSMDMSACPPGNYLIKATTLKGVVTKKIIKR